MHCARSSAKCRNRGELGHPTGSSLHSELILFMDRGLPLFGREDVTIMQFKYVIGVRTATNYNSQIEAARIEAARIRAVSIPLA